MSKRRAERSGIQLSVDDDGHPFYNTSKESATDWAGRNEALLLLGRRGSGVIFHRASHYFTEQAFPFYINRVTIGKGVPVPAHSHDFVELVYVAKGGALHEMSGITYELKPGDVFVIEPDVLHSYRGSERKETVVYNVLFDRELLQRELLLNEIADFVNFFYLAPFLRKSATFYPYVSLTGPDKAEFDMHIDKMMAEQEAQQPGYRLVIKTRLIESMVLLSRCYNVQAQTASLNRPDGEWIGSIVRFLQQYFNQPFTLEQLCGMCGMGVSTFTTKFKTFTGKTVIEYIHDLRIEAACRLLAETDKKIVDIAQEVGFEDLSFFYKVFGKKESVPPSKYRKRLQNGQQARQQ